MHQPRLMPHRAAACNDRPRLRCGLPVFHRRFGRQRGPDRVLERLHAWPQVSRVPSDDELVRGIEVHTVLRVLSAEHVSTARVQHLAAEAFGEATLLRVASNLRGVNSVFETLGLHLVQTSVSGAQAAGELVQLVGGLDAFLAKTQAYVSSYFTQAEQLGLGAKDVLKSLQSAGIDFSAATSRSDLRSLMEQLDPNSADGRGQMAALLNVAGDFAKLTDYLAEQGLTLGQLASQAPAAGIAMAQDANTRSADAAEQSAATLQASKDRLDSIAQSSAATVDRLEALVALQAAANQQLIAQLQAMTQAQLDSAAMGDLVPHSTSDGM